MISKEIEANFEKLTVNLNNDEFIYDLLLAWPIHDVTMVKQTQRPLKASFMKELTKIEAV